MLGQLYRGDFRGEHHDAVTFVAAVFVVQMADPFDRLEIVQSPEQGEVGRAEWLRDVAQYLMQRAFQYP